jgi:SSS family solute:Na+ symporter
VAGGCYFLGGFGKLYFDDMLAGGYISESGKVMFDKVVPTMLQSLAPVVVALIIVLVLAASMSTLSSLVLTSSSTLTLDVVKPAVEKKAPMSDKRSVLVMRLFIVFFIALSAVIAILKDSVWKDSVFIAQMMGVSWGALAGAFLAPFLYGLYWKGVTKSAVAVSFVFGTGIEIVQLIKDLCGISLPEGILSFVFTNSLYSGVFAMVGGLILVPVVSLITKKPDKAEVDKMFACYDRKVLVDAKQNLGSK